MLLTLYSPYMLINNMVGAETATRLSGRTAAYRGIGMTESLLQFVRAHQAGLDGFYHSTQGGEARRLPARASLRPVFARTIWRSWARSTVLPVQHPARVRLPRGLR